MMMMMKCLVPFKTHWYNPYPDDNDECSACSSRLFDGVNGDGDDDVDNDGTDGDDDDSNAAEYLSYWSSNSFDDISNALICF